MKIIINLPPVSKKNSQRIVMNKKTGKPFLLPSKAYAEYEKKAGFFIPKLKEPINEPVTAKCLFYMPTRRKCDLNNLLEAATDVLVHYGVLTDDNYSIVASHDGSRVLYDKNNGRTEIEIKKYTECN